MARVAARGCAWNQEPKHFIHCCFHMECGAPVRHHQHALPSQASATTTCSSPASPRTLPPLPTLPPWPPSTWPGCSWARSGAAAAVGVVEVGVGGWGRWCNFNQREARLGLEDNSDTLRLLLVPFLSSLQHPKVTWASSLARR